jgi:hypothetical protein
MRVPHHPRSCRFRRVAGFATISMLGLGLAGCFTSKEPLIAAGASDHPLAAGTRFTEAVNCASVSLGCDSRIGYRPIATGSVTIEGGQYILHYDPGSNIAFSLPAARGANKLGLMFKSIGQDLYIAQLDDGPQQAGEEALPRYLYELIRMQGGNLYVYKYMCEENGDLGYVKSGQLDAVTTKLGVAVCRASSLEGLAAVFRARLANGAPPSERLQLKQG